MINLLGPVTLRVKFEDGRDKVGETLELSYHSVSARHQREQLLTTGVTL